MANKSKTPLGEMLYLFRAHHRLKVRQLARRINILPSTLCRIEAGKECNAHTFVRILEWMTTHELPEVLR